jgi:Repeat of Unknown Function (DUF347)
MSSALEDYATKVPAVTLVFWIIKIAATTLGETGGDSVTMTLGWGYLTGTAIFLSIMIVLIGLQIAAKKFHPSCTGPPSWPPRPPAPPWLILPIVLWGSVTPEDHRYCFSA